MKRFLVPVVLILFNVTLFAEEIETPNILVYGTATTWIVPDEMTWFLTVNNTGNELEEVANRHLDIVQKALRVLKKEKVAEKDIQTAQMEFGENWVYRNSSRLQEGYFASTRISFKINDFKKYRSLWVGISKIEYVGVDGVYYGHSKRIDFQNETRKKALLAAKDKALTLAETMGSGIGRPLLIEEDLSSESISGMGQINVEMVSEFKLVNEDEVVLGTIPVRIRMKAVFELIAGNE